MGSTMTRFRTALLFLIAIGMLTALVQSKAIESGEEESFFIDLVSGDLNEAISSEPKEEKSPIVKRSGGAAHIFPGQGLGFGLMQNTLIDKYASGQSHLSECMPGSIFYNGTCIYFSSKHQKLSWLHAERFCRRLPLDTTYLTIKNDHEFEVLKREIIRIAQKEDPVDQLVFYIGFRFYENEWKWVNNQSLKSTNLTLGKYWWDWTGSHGDCGSLALLKTNELVMRSAPCLSTQGRFLCQYTLNPCYQNDVCGKYGRCVNLYQKFYCDCSVTIFYEGKYCERWNLAMIQTIIGSILTMLLVLTIFCNTTWFNNLWNKYFGFETLTEDERIEQLFGRYDDNDLDVKSLGRPDDFGELSDSGGPPHAAVKFADDTDTFGTPMTSKTPPLFYSISTKFKKLKEEFSFHIKRKTKQEVSAYLLLFILTTFFTATQVMVIHGFTKVDRINMAKNYTSVKYMCDMLEENFLLEELIYLVPALFFFVILWFYHRQRRFNKYIMVKFKSYIEEPYYKQLQEESKKRHKANERKLENKLKRSGGCGLCRYKIYKMFKNGFCRCFCCVFCCSCCVPPGSNNRCFLSYCCWQGWKQTNFHKVLSTIKNFLYYVFFCCVWKKLWQVTKEQRKNKQELRKKRARSKQRKLKQLGFESDDDNTLTDKQLKKKRKKITQQEMTEINEFIDDFDPDDFNEKQEFKRTTFPFPSMPFSTSNRSQSAAVYVIYTYDVLNIFVYIYTANMKTVELPWVGRPNGVLFDFAIQIIHVLLIGIKFYPILVVADMDPWSMVYLSASIYMGIIWTLKLFTKGFCSRTEAFVKRTLKKISHDVGDSLVGGKLKNATKTVIDMFSEDPGANQKYLKALKEGIPNVFREYFGNYDENEARNIIQSTNEDLILLNENTLGYSTNSANRYYLEELIQTTTTTTMASTTATPKFDSFAETSGTNGTRSLLEILSNRYPASEMTISILENMPLYLTLSFLLSRYIILFFGTITDTILETLVRRRKNKKNKKSDFLNKFMENQELGFTSQQAKQISEGMESYLNDLQDYQDEDYFTRQIAQKDNHNYNYIKRLVKRIRINKFFDYKDTRHGKPHVKNNKVKKEITKRVSYMWYFFNHYIYANVPYMKYSKQFVNTYTVAFMVIYFFTLFGFRLSNIFGSTVVVTIELIYRFIFRGMIPTFNFDDHNFNAEFRITCLVTSGVAACQMLLSIRNFHNDLIKLHRGDKIIQALTSKYAECNDKRKKVRDKESSTITSDSLHFPGYLIAHLVYGYFLLFMVFFCCAILIKLLFYFPKVLQTSSQIILPLIILVSLKLILIQVATRVIFLREDGQRITNLAPYYTLSYFNFFFDCFLGLVACMSRVWQTTVISLLTLPRLDKSMFNKDSDLIMRRLDKGHLAYLNYVRMEHWYNNPVVNGFCEMLIESMLYSQIYKTKYVSKAFHGVKITQHKVQKDKSMLLVQNSMVQTSQPPRSAHSNVNKFKDSFTNQHHSKIIFSSPILIPMEGTLNPLANIDGDGRVIKKSNPHFKYEQFLRLRNMFFLCLMLKRNESLRKLRYHYLLAQAKNKNKAPEVEVGKFQLFSPFLGKGLQKIITKAKESFTGSKASVNKRYDSRFSMDHDPYFNDTTHTDELDEEGSSQSSTPVRYVSAAGAHKPFNWNGTRRVRTNSV